MTDPANDQAIQLHSLLAGHTALPYLFIGSGFARRYIGLPDWQGLLTHFASSIGQDFRYHLASAGGDLPQAASSIARVFHDHWWTSPLYEDQRQLHGQDVRDELGALKVAVATYIQEHDALGPGSPGVDDAQLAEELLQLRSAIVDGVITTNYDSLTDQLFPQFKPYVGQDELLLSDAQFIAETYKIHGSAAKPGTLVLTAEDYEASSKRNHYLAAKLLTIFAEHPVLFVGYSLTDTYIGEILDNIATAVGPERIDELGHRIYFVEWNADTAFEPVIEHAQLVREDFRLPITRIETHSLAWIWESLARLDRPFPAAVLRELRKHVYDLVTSPEPSQGREVVRAIPIDAEDADDLRVVFGVGAFSEQDLANLSTIGRTLTREDLDKDILGIRKRSFHPENLLLDGIPNGIRAGATSNLPVHKYLRAAGRVDREGAINFDGLPSVIEALATKQLTTSAQSKARFTRDVEGMLTTPREVMASDLAFYFKIDCILLLDESNYTTDDLRSVLAAAYDSRDANSSTNRAALRKALCFLDRREVRELVTNEAEPA